MDIQILIMPIIVFGFGIFGGAMFAYRKMTVGEAFNWGKFLPMMGIGGLVAVVAYITTGVMPGLDQIFTQIELAMPGGAPSLTVIIALLLAVYNAIAKKDTNPLPALPTYTSATPVTTPTTGTPQWSPGFTVTPVELKGVSPFAALLTIVVGNDPKSQRCNVRIDWMDGTPVEDFIPDPTSGQVVVSHAYQYLQGTSKYTGHQFYPKFTVIGKDGTVYGEFNVGNKCCSIEVQSPK